MRTSIRKGIAAGFITLAEYPNVEQGYNDIAARPAVVNATQKIDAATSSNVEASLYSLVK